MKNLFAIVFVLVLMGCSKSDTIPPFTEESDLFGTWLLTEQLSDPGDGSGEFRPVVSEKMITFFEDGTFQINGSLFLNVETGPLIRGIYVTSNTNLATPSSDNFLVMDNAPDNSFPTLFFFEGNALELIYPCEEGCGERFRKVRN